MKRYIVSIVLFLILHATTACADQTANIRMNISGTASDNTYFMCIPNIGCLSILAGDEGKTYPVYHPIEMSGIYVTNIDHNFKLSDEGMPASCSGTVATGHTITISGNIHQEPNGAVLLAGLHCSQG